MVQSALTQESKDRDCDPVHASDLTKEPFCARELWLRKKYKLAGREQFIPASVGWSFKFGDFLNQVMTEHLFPEQVYGKWECSNVQCKHTYMGLGKKKCPNCGNKYEYKELVIIDDELNTTSSYDVFIVDGKRILLHEIKSIDKDKFRDLTKPLQEHNVRTQLYMSIIQENIKKFPNLDKYMDKTGFYVAYFCKCAGLKDHTTGRVTPIKAFWVDYDKTLAEPYMDRAKLVAGKKAPDPISEKRSNKHCLKCTVKEKCKSEK